MKKHLLSFLKSPLGYIANLIATISQYVPLPDRPIIWACETFCIKDGVQDDPLF